MSRTAELLAGYSLKSKDAVHRKEHGRLDSRNNQIEENIQSLEDMDIRDLRHKWICIMRFTSMPKWNKSFFIPRLAYRMQEIAYNTSLSKEARDYLLEMAKAPTYEHYVIKKAGRRSKRVFLPGQIVSISYQGKADSFTALANGYLYKDKYYKHLGNVVKAMTGYKINIEELLAHEQK